MVLETVFIVEGASLTLGIPKTLVVAITMSEKALADNTPTSVPDKASIEGAKTTLAGVSVFTVVCAEVAAADLTVAPSGDTVIVVEVADRAIFVPNACVFALPMLARVRADTTRAAPALTFAVVGATIARAVANALTIALAEVTRIHFS